jgi:hypothetical protein
MMLRLGQFAEPAAASFVRSDQDELKPLRSSVPIRTVEPLKGF